MRIYITFALLFLFVGCSSHIKQQNSNLTLPNSFEDTSNQSPSNISTSWWKSFNSTTLNNLIEQAKENSYDVEIASQRLEQSRLELENAGISYYPKVDLSVGSSARKTKTHSSPWSSSKSTSAQVGVRYELDLWGKISSREDIAKSSYLISKYDKDAIMLTLYSSVAQGYFNLLATKEKLRIAKENYKIALSLMDIVRVKYQEGVISSLDLYEQQSTLLIVESQVKSLEYQVKQYKNALAILIGYAPQNWSVAYDDFLSINLPLVDSGLPSELLLNRPDIAIAKEKINLSNAATRVAQASRFPSFSLSASGGVSSAALLSFKDPTSLLSLALNAAYTLIDYGELKNLKEIEVSKTKVAIATYNKTVLNALSECENALTNLAYQKEVSNTKEDIVQLNRRSFDISTLQYRQGAIDFSSLLNSQRDYFSARESQINQRLEHLNSIITLYKVLGGGWSVK